MKTRSETSNERGIAADEILSEELEGFVSVWAGQFFANDEDEFYEYLQESYGEEDTDPLMTSRFITDSGVKWYDEDFREGIFSPNGRMTSFKSLLQQCSFSTSFSANALKDAERKGITKVNCVLAIGDLKHNGEMLNDASGLRFVGYYPYTKD